MRSARSEFNEQFFKVDDYLKDIKKYCYSGDYKNADILCYNLLVELQCLNSLIVRYRKEGNRIL